MPSEEGVGQHLRKVREALDLSRGEVAAGLYLKEDIITALEKDDQDALPGPVFVQGYIRKYARLLNIPEEPLLEAYSQQIAPHKRHKKNEGPLAGSAIRPEINSKHAIMRLITWAIVLGLLALLVIWWQGDMQWSMGQSEEEQPVALQGDKPEYSFAPENAKPNVASFSEEEKEVTDEPNLSQEPIAREQITMPEAEVQVALDEQPVDSIQDEAAVGDLPSEMSENKPENDEVSLVSEVVETAAEIEVAITDESAATAQEPNVLPEDISETSSVDDAEQTPPAPIDYASSIVIEFSEACWTEIRGANDSYKLLGNMQEGERRVLGGEPPYTFLLGNSQAATLTIKGERFDIKARSRANVARFTLQAEDIPAF